MFDHLDDPEPFEPDGRFRTAVLDRSRSRRRRRALARAGAGALVAVAVVARVVAVDVFTRVDRIEQVDVAGVTSDGAPGEASTVLFVGTDGGVPLFSEGGDPDTESQARTDSIVLARVDPAEDRLTVLPLPRDLWVDIAGSGPNRINHATLGGGPALLVETIESELGIEVDHYLALDFDGVTGIGDALGGLPMEFPAAVRDPSSGFKAEAGCQRLDGVQILGLSRSRRLEVRGENGIWHADPTSDFGRIERQQAVAAAVLAQIADLDASSPGELDALLDVAVENMTMDSETTPAELLALVRLIVGSEVEQLRLPVVDAVRSGATVLDPGPGAREVLDQFGAADPAIEEAPVRELPESEIAPAAAAVVPTPC